MKLRKKIDKKWKKQINVGIKKQNNLTSIINL